MAVPKGKEEKVKVCVIPRPNGEKLDSKSLRDVKDKVSDTGKADGAHVVRVPPSTAFPDDLTTVVSNKPLSANQAGKVARRAEHSQLASNGTVPNPVIGEVSLPPDESQV